MVTGAISISSRVLNLALGLYLFVCGFGLAFAQSNTKVAIVVYSDDQSLSGLTSKLKKELEKKFSSVDGFELIDVYDRLKRTEVQSSPWDKWDKIASLLEQGKKAYDSLELDKAVSFLKKGERLIFSNPESPFKMDVFVQTLTYLGASSVFVGRKKQGLKFFKRLIAINPKAEIDAVLFPPSLCASFKKASRMLRKELRGEIFLDSDPSGAKIWLDGRPVGNTPQKVTGLLPGRHIVRMTHSGYTNTGKVIELAPGASEKVLLSMDMLMGTAWLNSLLQRLIAAVGASEYPDEVDQLLKKVDADRFVFVGVSPLGQEVRILGYHWDGVTGRRLRALESIMDPASVDFHSKVDELFSSLSMDPASSMVGMQTQADASADDYGESGFGRSGEEEHSGILGTWWLWTAVGVVVVGAGLTAGLLLMDSNGSDSAQVVFRF